MRLKAHVIEQSINEQLYICSFCKHHIIDGDLPGRCVLNGLESVPVPQELECLNRLEKHLIQRAKCFMCIVRLKPYSLKAPSHNSLKASSRAVCYLPLSTSKTQETLDQVEGPSGSLPDPEVCIILHTAPTKRNVVYHSLVNVNKVKGAFQWLIRHNRFYFDLDDATRKVIGEVDQATSTLIEKANLAEFQSYTLRDMDTQVPVSSDVDSYKLNCVQEHPLDNRQEHLDILCFPSLFPTGEFGQFHSREKYLTPSEYVKSRLLSKNLRYRKDEQFVFYLYHQMRNRALCSGIYNLLKVSTASPMTVHILINQVDRSDEELEANLSTIFQNIRGTKQYWFLRQSELKCMVREYGPPTLFLTFSCAEYESADIIEYLKKVNNIPPDQKVNPGKLCTQDPVSVTRQFTHKFKSFFRTMLLKGKVLGEVEHFYRKREYQARGAPHFHVLLWINDAPVIGRDSADKVLLWIQERICCSIPDAKSCPELHRLVTRYQLHKCTEYCK